MSPQQLPLDAGDLLPLHEAFQRTALNERYTFEQAMSRPLIAWCLRNLAVAICKKRSEQ